MKVWTDREGKDVSATEFMSRWKSGIQKITPMQQTQSQIFGQVVLLGGIILLGFFAFRSRNKSKS